MTTRTIWFGPSNFSQKQQSMIKNFMFKADINPATVFFTSLEQRVPGLWYKRTQKLWDVNPALMGKAQEAIDDLVERVKPTHIVVNSPASLKFFADHTSLMSCRGSVYRWRGIPVLVFDDILKLNWQKSYSWIYLHDMKKLKRWHDNAQRINPKFQLTVCSSRADLLRLLEVANRSVIISSDVETAARFITCVGYSCLLPDGSIHTFVIPFVNPLAEGGIYWEDAKLEVLAWEVAREVNANPVPKVLQNGMYDSAWFIRFRVPLNNYFIDTMHLFHSIWTEAPKTLNFISAMALDYIRYWKDEIKGETKSKAEREKQIRIPQTKIGLEMYWRYNGLDCHNTLASSFWLMETMALSNMGWARENYSQEFTDQLGWCLAMSMRGLRTNSDRQMYYYLTLSKKADQALADVRAMVDDQEFNPMSSEQVASLIYDVLGAKPIKSRGKNKSQERSADEKMLKFIRLQHPLYAVVIDKIWEYKKSRNNMTKYGEAKLMNGRLMYQIAMLTETGRTNSKQHMFWVGTNGQNIPDDMRDMLVADPGKMIGDADYSQSDSYFVAHECEDPEMIKVVTDDRDTHSVHASFFYKEPYQKIVDAAKAKDPWAVHPIKGVRQNTKRITHGANYRMAGYTMYIVMGHESVMGTASAMGLAPDCYQWPIKMCAKFCQGLIDSYTYNLYPGLPDWFRNSVRECIDNGNLATCYGDRTRLFFGDMERDEGLQRELSSYFGQGGTAGNINRALRNTYYRSGLEVAMQFADAEKRKIDSKQKLESNGLQLMLQVHDSNIFQVDLGDFDTVDRFLTIMGEPCTVKGRTFSIPVECDLGLSWGKRSMVGYKQGATTVQDILAKEELVCQKFLS